LGPVLKRLGSGLRPWIPRRAKKGVDGGVQVRLPGSLFFMTRCSGGWGKTVALGHDKNHFGDVKKRVLQCEWFWFRQIWLYVLKIFEHTSTIIGYLFELDVGFGIYFLNFQYLAINSPKKQFPYHIFEKKKKFGNCPKFTQKTIGIYDSSIIRLLLQFLGRWKFTFYCTYPARKSISFII
jgi:hypothetical protein